MSRYRRRNYHRPRTARFTDFYTMCAKYPGECKQCKKETQPGETIAYAWKGAGIYCEDCYHAWSREVYEEDQLCR